MISSEVYGVPSKRKRFYMIATKEGFSIPYINPTEKMLSGKIKKQSWDESISDLIPTLAPSKLTVNQINTLDKFGITDALIDRCSSEGRRTHFRTKGQYAQTLTTQTKFKIRMDNQVYDVNNRVLARLQSFPDTFNFDCKHPIARVAIGNSVPPLVMKFICEQIKKINI